MKAAGSSLGQPSRLHHGVGGQFYTPGMRSLDPDTHLSVRLGAVMCRNQYTGTPDPVIAQLHAMAGDRTDILAREVGMWVGFYDNPHTQRLRTALLEAFADLDLDPWVELGRRRFATRPHTTPGSA